MHMCWPSIRVSSRKVGAVHTPGLGRFWNSCTGRAELGLEIHVLAWVDVTANTAYAIQAALTPPEPARVARTAPRTTGTATQAAKAEDSRVDAYLAHVRRVIPEHGLSALRYLSADGYFGKVIPILFQRVTISKGKQ